MVKNLDIRLLNINGLFLALVCLVPFTTLLLGEYPQFQTPIIIYSINIILIGLVLIGIRSYVINSKNIETIELTQKDKRHGLIRLSLPIFLNILAIPVSFYATSFALYLIIISIAVHYLPGLVDGVDKVIPGKEY